MDVCCWVTLPSIMTSSPHEVKAAIPHTWPLFFTRHGRFTPIQQQAIPLILNGRDTLLIAATAAGKTEAVIAPLLERHWPRLTQSPNLQSPNLQSPISPLAILYICPTRALVRDLYQRLREPLADSGISLGWKTGDAPYLDAERPPAILITTPESADSLLTRAPRLFAGLQAIALDEIHLFDNAPRGDQIRCLLPRIERIRQYADPEAGFMQRIALSATVPDPEGIARRYLRDGAIVSAPGGRQIEAEITPLYDLSELVNALGRRAAQKTLLFCNSRDEVEETAVYLRRHLPHHAEIFVHYSNLDAKVRLEVETRFAAASAAVCVSTSTLELGIDIGSVDDVALLGAPPDLTSFLQRIGRGSRRAAHTRVLCLLKSPGEWARFEALLALAQPSSPHSLTASATCAFRPSVLIQQIFSLIKQSPTGSVRRADVRRIAPPEVSSDDINRILAQLTFARYLRAGRLGEWKPDVELEELLDRHEIYANIGADVRAATAVDAYTGKTIAQTERVYKKGTIVLFGGKLMKVVWQDDYRFGLAAAPGQTADDILRFQKTYAAVPFAVTQAVARSLDLQPGQMAALPTENGIYLFHFWGTVWGELLTAVLLNQALAAEAINEYCLLARPPLTQLPAWEEKIGREAARQYAPAAANYLEMGRFHSLLPADVAETAVLRLLDLSQFSQLYREVALVKRPELYEKLHQLL
ncbi:MAG TPA: DEAD/DEAH box helicase [Anaerolineae bacterium]|nr:DEAD/DEAH box helicase [Anaerolineae bacterium]